MNLIYDHAIDESFATGTIEKVISDGAFMMVYMEDYSEPEFFIMTDYSIEELKEIELKEYEDYGMVLFNIGFDSNTNLEEGDYFDIFDDDKGVIGAQLSYKVSLKNLQALKENLSERNARVISYSCVNKKALENQFYRWFYSNYKSDLSEISKSSEVFTKKENYKDLMNSTIKIAADNILESNVLTFWDAVDVARCHKSPSDLEEDFTEILEFNQVKEFVPILF